MFRQTEKIKVEKSARDNQIFFTNLQTPEMEIFIIFQALFVH